MLALFGGGMVSAISSGTVQVNVRVDRQLRERAEEVLHFSGMTLPGIIKDMIAKIAQGGEQCSEILSAVDTTPAPISAGSPFDASWAAADQLYRDLGISSEPGLDERDWETVYSESMDAHFREKGLIL